MNKIRIGDGLVHDGMIWTLTVIEAFRHRWSPLRNSRQIATLEILHPSKVAKSKSIYET